MNVTKAIKNHQRNTFRTFWVLMFLVISLLFTACSESRAKKPKKKNFIEQGDQIHFKLGGEDFKVDKAYFRGGSETQWGALHYAKFWALLPDFEVYDKSKNHHEFVEELGWGRKVFFRLHLREVSRNSVPVIIDQHKSKKGHKRFSGRLGKPDEVKYGLEVYYTNKKSFDDYLYRPEGKAVVYMTCGSKIVNLPSPSCKMHWDHSTTVYADAVFSKEYLPEWHEILNSIMQIVNR
ncbi:MAG: hypothetical protein KZQ81_17690 [Candidatus Thiodiazotropha sp. (ex Rostrolucina anterorostrata)]|nr:hypothetical protein [Candidatus Thiodiazotropha sp. (ex Rostrolucina anterorostrata)]